MRSKVLLRGFAFAILFSQALGQTGFTSIDCGLPLEDTGYNDTRTGIIYTSDQNLYIDTGVISTADAKLINDSDDRQLRTVRYFPQKQNQGSRSCYNLTSLEAASRRYLIRATFRYGNYDGKNQSPAFHLYLGVDFWDTVEIKDSTSVITKEIIHVPSSNNLQVCLVNTGAGTPFISALELRQLTNDSYITSDSGESLALSRRWNFAPADPRKVIRFPDDKYDRLWHPFPNPDYWVALIMNTTSPDFPDNTFSPPDAVMKSAAAPRNPDQFLAFVWYPPGVDSRYYLYFHFNEVVRLRKGELRRILIVVNGYRWRNEVVPSYLWKSTFYDGIAEPVFNFSLRKAENSTLPPILNAFESYLVKQMLQLQTDENDVSAILNIKSTYGVKRDWQGDPCLPKAFIWSGLDCVTNAGTSTPPRISSLNLSSYGLNGTMSFYFSELTSLESLDLSDNNLHGSIPHFLAELPLLKVLNLLGNNFSGSIPLILLDKASSGLLQLSVDESRSGTPDKCESDKCKSGKNSNFLAILIAVLSTASILVILASILLIWRFKRNKPQVARLGSLSQDGFLQTKNIKFSYSDLLKMTNNFQRVLGIGGFGTVYHGIIADGKEVAVKLLSQSSAQGYNEFQIEAELLTRVHHRNLTILVGYCYEDNHMALVYEYMAHGNLKEHLSGDAIVLSWSERLHILSDAAQGLEYLHNGCKPPIIHRDIKSTNILLNENLEAKLADFGLSRAYTVDEGSYISTRVVGTPGYLDPEYYEMERLHEKSDIYSFGVVILELITGRPVFSGVDQGRCHIVQWVSNLLDTGDIASIVDLKLRGVYDAGSVWRALETAVACTSPTSLDRPNTARVLAELKDCLAAEKTRSEGRQDTDASYLHGANTGSLEFEVGAR